jgi:hypothetical protein
LGFLSIDRKRCQPPHQINHDSIYPGYVHLQSNDLDIVGKLEKMSILSGSELEQGGLLLNESTKVDTGWCKKEVISSTP